MRYAEHEVFQAPDNLDATVWRYIDFTKLVSLLATESLFFARADLLGDAFEGSFSQANLEARSARYPDRPEMLTIVPLAHQWFRLHTFINCWNLDEHESGALWRLYVPPQGGVALKSTFRRLTECFRASTDDGADPQDRVYAGRVQYIDYEREVIPEGSTLLQFMRKRRSFGFENEVRALIQNFPLSGEADEEGFATLRVSERDLAYPPSLPVRPVEIDLGVLVDAIHISPVAPARFSDLVRSVCAHYGLERPVIQSSLAGEPVY